MNIHTCFCSLRRSRLVRHIAFGLLLLAVAFTPAAGAQAQLIPLVEGPPVYLPMITAAPPVDPTMPTLTSPQNGAVLATLIPTFIWDTGTQPDNTAGCLALSATPNPTDCHMSYGIGYYGSHMERLMWYNLDPDTVYYWKVGVIYNNDYDHPKWSTEWSFTTGPAGGPIMPGPVLQSPSNGSAVSSTTALFTWLPVDGAAEYSLHIRGVGTYRMAAFDEIKATQVEINVADMVRRGYGTNLEWWVTTHNDYAWGNDSEAWGFTYTGPTYTSTSSADEENFVLDQEGHRVVQMR